MGYCLSSQGHGNCRKKVIGHAVVSHRNELVLFNLEKCYLEKYLSVTSFLKTSDWFFIFSWTFQFSCPWMLVTMFPLSVFFPWWTHEPSFFNLLRMDTSAYAQRVPSAGGLGLDTSKGPVSKVKLESYSSSLSLALSFYRVTQKARSYLIQRNDPWILQLPVCFTVINTQVYLKALCTRVMQDLWRGCIFIYLRLGTVRVNILKVSDKRRVRLVTVVWSVSNSILIFRTLFKITSNPSWKLLVKPRQYLPGQFGECITEPQGLYTFNLQRQQEI